MRCPHSSHGGGVRGMDVGMHVESLIAGNIAGNKAMTARVSNPSNPPVIVLLFVKCVSYCYLTMNSEQRISRLCWFSKEAQICKTV